MKNIYTLLIFFFVTLVSTAQGYKFGIVHITNYDFKIVAITDFDSNATAPPPNYQTNVSDVGFTLVLPAGTVDAVNATGLLTARPWTIQQFDAAFLTGLGLGDGTKDVFQFNLPPGQSLVPHTSGQQIDLVSFQITNTPNSGEVYILLNSDPIAMGAVGVLDSFYNSDIDGPGIGNGTLNFFNGLAPGMGSFMFSTLNVEDIELSQIFINIYPNPVSNILNISTSHILEKIEFYDILGKQVFTAINASQIDVSSLKSGIYVLKIKTEKGNVVKKIVVE